MLGEGMSALSADGTELSAAERQAVEALFSSVGKTVWVTEDLMDIVTGISGSSPAYAYMYIEGLINAGVAGGLTREAATILAAQSTLGAAKMVLENMGAPDASGELTGGTDPTQLRINVCSPGGTTIEAVKVLEEAGFVDIIEKAANASAAKSKVMTK
jgi:pyrroline-5-carboxylate reductase